MKRSGEPRDVPELEEVKVPDFKRKKIEPNVDDSVRPIIDIFGLNADVLRHIFDYCTVPDLCAFAASCDGLKQLILDNGNISRRLFDFEELADCCHILDIFKMFGKQMARIKISERDVHYNERTTSALDKILQWISSYCAVDTLKYLDLEYYYSSRVKKQYIHAALPFLHRIEYLSVSEYSRDGHICFCANQPQNSSIDDLVARIIGNARVLTSIQLIGLDVTGRFFFADHVRNLNNLAVVQCNIRAPDGFIAFLESAPKLKSFKWDTSSLAGMDTASSHSSDVVYELVAKNLPDLEVFHYHQNKTYVTDRNRRAYVPNFTYPNHRLIRQFRKLRVLGLKTMSMSCLMLLAEMNQVEELAADLPLNATSNFNFLNTFTNLKSVAFHSHDVGKQNCINYLESLPQLTKCHMKISELFPNFEAVLVKAVDTAKDLSVLSVSLLAGTLEADLYQKLLDARLARAGDSVNPLTLCLEKDELNRFMDCLGQAYRPDIIKIQ